MSEPAGVRDLVEAGGEARLPASRLRVTTFGVNDPRWLAFASSRAEALIFHHPGWARALMEEYGREPFALACEDESGAVQGLLPLLETQGLPFNFGEHVMARRLASLPRTPVAGPLATGHEAARLLAEAAIVRAQQAGLTLQIKTSAPELDGLVEGMAGVPWKQSYVIRLPEAGEEMRFGNARRTHRVKWAANRAVKLGVSVRWADDERDLRRWYRLYLETLRWHRSLPRPYRFFAALWRNLQPLNLMRLLLSEHEQELLSGCIYLVSGRILYCWLNGRRRDGLDLHPNDALHWHAMQEACREGFQIYDFGEVDEDQQGLIEFKTKWGAEPRRSYRYYYPAPEGLREPGPSSEKYSQRVQTFLWRRLPLALTAAVGDSVYRYL